MVYIALLKTMGYDEKVRKLYNGSVIPYNYKWYLYAEVFPRINNQRRNKLLRKGKEDTSHSLSSFSSKQKEEAHGPKLHVHR